MTAVETPDRKLAEVPPTELAQLLEAGKGDKKLKAYAYLTASFNDKSNITDTIDCLLPFVTAGIAEQAGQPLNLEKLSAFVKGLGLNIPVYVLQQLQPRLQKAGIIAWNETKRQHICLPQPQIEEIPSINNPTMLGDIFENIEIRLSQYASRHGVIKVPLSATWGDALINFLKSESASEVLRTTNVKGVIFGDSRQIETFVVARFIQECEFSSSVLFDHIVSVFTGILIEDFLVNIQSIGSEKNFDKLNVIYDTTVLLRILGTSGRLMQTATMEMHRTLQDLRCKTFYFDFTEVEFVNILQTLLNNHAAGQELFNETGDAIASGDINIGTLRDILSTFSVRLGQLNIFPFVYKYNSRTGEDKFQIDEQAFVRTLELEAQKRGRTYKRESASTDAKSIALILRLRRGATRREVGTSGYIFVSHNVTLQRAARLFVHENVDGYDALTIPPVLTVGQITTTGWLSLSKNIESNKVSKELLSSCFNAVRPSARWAEEFAKALRGYQNENPEFASARADTLLFLQTARNSAAEQTLGQAALLEKLNLTNLFNEAAQAAKEAESGRARELDRVREQASQEIDAITAKRNSDLEDLRRAADAEIDRIKTETANEVREQTRRAAAQAQENVEAIRRQELKTKITKIANDGTIYILKASIASLNVILFFVLNFYSVYLSQKYYISFENQIYVTYATGGALALLTQVIFLEKGFFGRIFTYIRNKQASYIANLAGGLLNSEAVDSEYLASATSFVNAQESRIQSSTNQQASNANHVVVLVHGIRDRALWQNAIKDTLRAKGFRVASTNYGRYDLFQFLLPIKFFRRWAIGEVTKQIRIAAQQNAGCKISVIAHSFGTYVVSNILIKEFDIKFHKIIFCGSVVQFRFPFEQVTHRFSPNIMNEVGTSDIWPAMAESITTGYGSAGTYGFVRPLVEDRYHSNANHGYFLNAKFCDDFWVPFLENGTVVPGATNPAQPRLWIRVLSVAKIKYFVSIALLFSLIYLANKLVPIVLLALK